MIAQEHSPLPVIGGLCCDCGMVVEQRVELIDGFTHSTVHLCIACWSAHKQQQAFAGGCCG